jgi:hypothetical protein
MKIDMRIGMIKVIGALCSFAGIGAIEAQVSSGVRFEVLTKDNVAYSLDATPFANYATAQERTATSTGGLNFGPYLTIADVVSINGKPANGVHVTRGNDIRLSSNRTNPPNGRAISDVNRGSIDHGIIELLQSDGTAVGTLMLQGFWAGPAPPGVPASWGTSNYAIVGGTGAFLGARGFCTWFRATNTPFIGNASVAEDPLRRRERGGDDYLIRCNLIPMYVPEIVNAWHEDFTPVTATKPVRAGEVLIVAARGLGPTRPGIEPGTPFPASPVQTVNSPIEMTAGGQTVEVINQIGWPGQENLYRVDFRMPKVDGSTIAALQITAAWIPGSAFTVPVQ